MRWLFSLLLLQRVSTEECSSTAFSDRNASVGPVSLRPPRAAAVLADIIGLDDAKQVLHEAVVLPASMAASVSRLFWRSGERGAVLLVGPSGLGKVAAAEAAATAAGALVLPLAADQVASSGFCRVALAAIRSNGQPVVVIVEAIDTAPMASLPVRHCLREAGESDDTASRIFIVATMSRELRSLSATALEPFGYIVQLGLPNESERMQFLLRLFQQISRIDPQWAVALREAAVSTLANLTATYTFSEIELVVRRAFVRSTNDEGSRDPVALHHFEKILAGMPPQATEAFTEAVPEPTTPMAAAGEHGKSHSETKKKKSKESKDPMDGIFGWCNYWLPEAIQLPPVVWAMIIFGILAHFMARSTYQPHHKRRGGAGARSSLFSDLGAAGGGAGGMGGGPGGAGGSYPSFGDNISDLYGGSPFGNFPPPPGMDRHSGGMPGMPGMGGPKGAPPGSEGAAAASTSSSSLPTAGVPKAASPPE